MIRIQDDIKLKKKHGKLFNKLTLPPLILTTYLVSFSK